MFRDDLIALYSYLRGAVGRWAMALFPQAASDRTRLNRLKQHQGKLRSDAGRKFSRESAIKDGSGAPCRAARRRWGRSAEVTARPSVPRSRACAGPRRAGGSGRAFPGLVAAAAPAAPGACPAASSPSPTSRTWSWPATSWARTAARAAPRPARRAVSAAPVRPRGCGRGPCVSRVPAALLWCGVGVSPWLPHRHLPSQTFLASRSSRCAAVRRCHSLSRSVEVKFFGHWPCVPQTLKVCRFLAGSAAVWRRSPKDDTRCARKVI